MSSSKISPTHYDYMYLISKEEYTDLKNGQLHEGKIQDAISGEIKESNVNNIEVTNGGTIVIKDDLSCRPCLQHDHLVTSKEADTLSLPPSSHPNGSNFNHPKKVGKTSHHAKEKYADRYNEYEYDTRQHLSPRSSDVNQSDLNHNNELHYAPPAFKGKRKKISHNDDPMDLLIKKRLDKLLGRNEKNEKRKRDDHTKSSKESNIFKKPRLSYDEDPEISFKKHPIISNDEKNKKPVTLIAPRTAQKRHAEENDDYEVKRSRVTDQNKEQQRLIQLKKYQEKQRQIENQKYPSLLAPHQNESLTYNAPLPLIAPRQNEALTYDAPLSLPAPPHFESLTYNAPLALPAPPQLKAITYESKKRGKKRQREMSPEVVLRRSKIKIPKLKLRGTKRRLSQNHSQMKKTHLDNYDNYELQLRKKGIKRNLPQSRSRMKKAYFDYDENAQDSWQLSNNRVERKRKHEDDESDLASFPPSKRNINTLENNDNAVDYDMW